MATSWPDNLSYKHATASKRSSDAGRRGTSSRSHVYEARPDNTDWLWSRPSKGPGSRSRLAGFESGRRDSAITGNRQRPTWEEEGIKAAKEYVAQHSRPDAASTAASRDRSWLRSLGSQRSQQEANTMPVKLPFDASWDTHHGPPPPSNFISSEPVDIHTVSVPEPCQYLPLTSEQRPPVKAPSPAGSIKWNAARPPLGKHSPASHGLPPKYSADSRVTLCSISLDVALKDMYETLRKAHALFSSYQTTFEEGAGPVIGKFKEEPLNLAWRDMIAEQFGTDVDKRQYEAVREGLGTRAKVVMASPHEHTPAPNHEIYHLEERARAARKVLERMEEVGKLTHRAREERLGCRFLLEEVEQLMGMLDPKTHPRLYSDMEKKRWVGIGQNGSKRAVSREGGCASTSTGHRPKKSCSLERDDGKGSWGETETDETCADQSGRAEVDSPGESGNNGIVSQQDHNDDHGQADRHDVDTNWE